MGGEEWAKVAEALNGAGVLSVQRRWDEMFVMGEDVDEDFFLDREKNAGENEVGDEVQKESNEQEMEEKRLKEKKVK